MNYALAMAKAHRNPASNHNARSTRLLSYVQRRRMLVASTHAAKTAWTVGFGQELGEAVTGGTPETSVSTHQR